MYVIVVGHIQLMAIVKIKKRRREKFIKINT